MIYILRLKTKKACYGGKYPNKPTFLLKNHPQGGVCNFALAECNQFDRIVCNQAENNIRLGRLHTRQALITYQDFLLE